MIIVGGPAARMTLSPDRATNAVGEPHVFTLHLETTDGAGWTDAAGEVVPIGIVSGIGWLSPGPYVTDASGRIVFTLNSDTPGDVVVLASWSGVVEEEEVKASDSAIKTYIEIGARLTLLPDGEHPVGEIHDLVALLEIYDGETWTNGTFEPVEILLVDGPGALSLGPYITDANGEVALDVTSDIVGASDIVASWAGQVQGRAASATDSAEVLWYDGDGGGGGTENECEQCPPPIPALKATKRSQLEIDADDDGVVSLGDTIRYTMRVENFAPFAVEGVQYLEIVDHHTRVEPESLDVDRVPLMLRNLDGIEAISGILGTLAPDEILEFSFLVRVSGTVDEDVALITSQGMIYTDSASPVWTDDPSTDPIHDETLTIVHQASSDQDVGSATGSASESLTLQKIALVPTSHDHRIATAGSFVEYELSILGPSDAIRDLRLIDVVGPYASVQSWVAPGADVHVWNVGSLQIIVADFEAHPAGAELELKYRASIHRHIPSNIGYVNTRAVAMGLGMLTLSSNDPQTDLAGDATAILFPHRCDAEDDERTWEDWLDVISQAPTSLLPLILSERDGAQHLRWVLFGGDFYGDVSAQPASQPPDWTKWAVVGLVEFDFDVVLSADPGFRLAHREEDYVREFLSQEPFFMWTDYDSSLFGRVPATDAGELLYCDGFVHGYCERAYLPLLVELDSSRDWEMRWLEDNLIVATVIGEM